MRYIREIKYFEEYKLILTFDNNKIKLVNLKDHLNSKIFFL